MEVEVEEGGGGLEVRGDEVGGEREFGGERREFGGERREFGGGGGGGGERREVGGERREFGGEARVWR